MSELKKKKYITGILIIVLLVGIVGLFSYGRVDKYKGLVKVSNVKLLSSVGSTTGLTSRGTEEVNYNLRYTLDEVSGITKRDVVIKGKLNSDYAVFKEIRRSNITSTLKENGKEIEITVEDVTLGEEQTLEIPIQITNAPNQENIVPEIKIKEATGEETRVVGQAITVETNSVLGIVYDENNIPVGNIELSINKNGREIRRTYTKENGTYNFSDLEAGTYQIKVEEEIYEIVSGSETSESNPQNIIKVKEVDKFDIETHKYIERLELVINGKKESYTYKDREKVIQAVKNAKTISGEIEYKIVVRNRGEKATAVERVIDEPGEGLEFKESKNTGWKKEEGIIKYKPIEGSTLKAKEKREIKLVLDIKDTKEIKTYINKLTTKGEIKEKVVYVVNNRVVKEESVVEGEKVRRPEDIEVEGWYTDKNYTNKYNFNNGVTKDIILYGKTEEQVREYTVRFIDKGQVVTSETVGEGNRVNRPSNPTKTGYRFNCWKKGTECFDFTTEIHEDIDLESDYNVETYRITYDLDGGIVSVDNPESYTVEQLPITLNNPSKIGHTFLGWTGSNGTTPGNVTIAEGTTEPLNYTAKYKKNSYQLEIDPKGGEYEGSKLLNEDYGTVVTINTPTRNGYNFTGWTLTGSGIYNNGMYTFGAGNGKLEANWEIETYNITYDLDDGSLGENVTNPESYTVEQLPITLNNPSKIGHTFLGWTGSNGTTPGNVTIAEGTTGPLNYTAKYKKNSYQLEIDPKGGEYEESKLLNEDYGTVVTINTPTRNGYNFTGWTLTGSGTYSNGSYTFGAGNGKLEANWEIVNYNIAYDYTSCKLEVEEITALNNKGSYTVEDSNFSLTNPNKYGYVFEGWTGTDLSEKTLNVEVDTSKAKNLSYVANCKLQKFTVTFKDGETVLGEKPVEYKKQVTPIGTPTKNGYTFDKWLLNGSEYNFGTEVTQNIVLQASWIPVDYEIKYKGISEEEIASLNNPTEYTIETETFTLNNPSDRLDQDGGGYVFVGWQEKEETTPSKPTVIEKGTTGNKEYTAIWNEREPNVYNITYNLNGGTLETANPTTYKKSQLPITLNNPSREGYTFLGWTGSNGDTPSNVTIPENTTGDLSYTANYRINSYNVEFYNMTAEGGYEKINGADLSKEYHSTISSSELPNAKLTGYTFKYWSLDKNTSYDYSEIEGNLKLYAVYQKNVYQITYDLDGGSLGENITNPTEYSVDTETFTLHNPSKKGYTFLGWTGSNGNTPQTTITLPDINSLDNKTYTANYEIIDYTVSYNYSSCNLTQEEITALNNRESYRVTDSNFSLTNPNKYGYIFEGWTGTDLSEKTLNVEVDTSKAKNLSYVANCKLDSYTVEFYNMNSDETTYTKVNNSDLSKDYNTTISSSELPSVSLTGYTFKYWSLDKTTEYSLSTRVVENIKLYAVYDIDEYQITYNLKEGNVTGNPSSYTVKDLPITLNNPTKTGHTFVGWTGSNGTTPEDVTIGVNTTGNLNYEAVYDIDQFNVEFYNMNSDETTYTKVLNVDLNKDYQGTISSSELPSVSLSGYTFKYWSLDKTTEYNLDTPIATNLKLYAVYQINTYTITYDLDGGSLGENVTNPESYTIKDLPITLNNPSKEGYTFKGWTGSNGEDPVENVTIPEGTTTNLSYTANYNKNKYTVTYMNGNNVHLVQPNIEYDTPTTAPASIPLKDHNIFVKWVDINDVEFDFSTHITSNITLYASFEEVEAPTISHSPTTWVRDKVTVTIASTHPEYTIKYKVGSGSYQTYNGPFEVTENTTVYAYSEISEITSVETSHEINNIDRMNPDINLFEIVEKTPTSIKVGITGQDNQSGLDKIRIYLGSKTEENKIFESDSYTSNLNEEKHLEYTISNLIHNSQYTIIVELEDKVGNKSEDSITDSTPHKHYVARVVGPTYDSPYDETDEQYYFESLREALESSTCVGSSCVIQMLEDVEETNVILGDQNVTIDLNGTTITGSQDKTFTVNETGSLRIIDKNDSAIGKVYADGTVIINNGTLYIGENEAELVVDANEPIIEGSVTGINSPGELHFLDGKVIGGSTTGALKGTSPITPYSYNASVETTGGKEIATLEVIADAEARINSVYYTKAQEAVDSSKIGTYEQPEGSSEIMSQIESKSNYRFIYDENTGTLTNNNQGFHNTIANSYIFFDLTNEANDKVISIDTTISSQLNYDFGYITVTNSKTVPSYDQTDGRIIYVSGSRKDSVNYVLKKGQKYYVHFGYYKNVNTNIDDDTFTINNIKLSDYSLGQENDFINDLVSNSEYHFVLQDNGTFVNNNNDNSGYTNNSTAHSYIKIDLTGINEEKYLTADMEFKLINGALAYVTVTNTEEIPPYDQEEGRQIYLNANTARKLYQIKLTPNEVNYVHFCSKKNNYGYDTTIYSIKYQDEISKEHLNSDITPNGTYYMNETNKKSNVWKDLSGNEHNGLVYGDQNLDDGFNSSSSSTYVTINGNLSDEALTQETIEIEFSSTNSRNQYLYNGANGIEPIVIGIVNRRILVRNSNYTYIAPEDMFNGNKHKLIATYDNENYELYYDGTKLEKTTNSGFLGSWTGETMIGSNTGEYSSSTIYSVKVYSRALSETEIENTSSITENVLLNLDYTDNAILMENSVFINNNQNQNNTIADSYMIFDFTNVPSGKTIYVNAEISSQLNGDYGYIYVTNSTATQNYSNSSNRYVVISGEVAAQEYPVQLTGGRINYVHFSYSKDNSLSVGQDTFKINYIKYYENSTSTIPSYIFSNTSTTKPYSPVINLNDEIDTVQLIRNVTVTSPLEIEETRNVILDLNGYTLTTNTNDYVINNEGQLKIIDSDYGNQNAAASQKFMNDQFLFNSEYTEKMQAKTEFYNNLQDEFDAEYVDDMSDYNQYFQNRDALIAELAESYKNYMNSEDYIEYTTIDFNYTGNEQVFTAPHTGTYKLETWGAQGGNATDTYIGGYGSYSVGEIALNQGDKLYINVGGQGESGCIDNACSGGYNGGGNSNPYIGDSNNYTAGGGGATSITTESGLLSTFESDTNKIVMVAAGGGGAYYHTYGTGYSSNGGSAGGKIGANNNSNGYAYATGGTQSSGGTSGFRGGVGSFGTGGSGEPGSSGGGAGYYGGGSAAHNSTGGGSGYIGNSSLSNKIMIMNSTDSTYESTDTNNQTKITTRVSGTPSSNYAKIGNGFAKITYQDSSAPKNHTIEEATNLITKYTVDYNYTGSYQEFVAPITAEYNIETWGAQGGTALCNNDLCTPGGKGGYSKGTISLTKGEKLYIYVGGKGSDGIYQQNSPASFNGGGSGTWDNNDDESAGAGGGATDIRLVSGVWDNNQSLASRIMVAGAGGGASYNFAPGYGGGLSGGNNEENGSLGATQTTGYMFGKGKNGSGTGDGDGVAGGGGGYYGGESFDSRVGESGSGGSGYISGHTGSVAIQAEDNTNPKYGCDNGTTDIECSYHYSGKKFTNTVIKAGNEFMPSYMNDELMTGNEGNGFARISFNVETFEKEDPSLINIPLTSENFGYLNTSYIGFNDNKITINRSYSNTQSVLYYKEPITFNNADSTVNYKHFKGIISLWDDFSDTESLGTVYIGFSRTQDNDREDFVSFKQYEINSLSTNKKTIDFDVDSPTIPGDYYFKIIIYHNNATDGNTVCFTLEELNYQIGAVRKNANDKILEYASDIYTMDDYISTGLLLHYDGLERGNNETKWKDLSGRNNDGNINNLTYDSTTGSYLFSSSSYGYVEIPNSSIYTNTEETVEIMFNPRNTNNQTIYSGNTNEQVSITVHSGYIIVSLGSSYSTFYLPSDFADGTVKFISVVYDNGEYKVYYNNEELDKRSDTNYVNKNTSTYIGRRNDGYYYNGNLYNIKVYNRALKPDEIARNYNVNVTRYNIDKEIVKRIPSLDKTSQNGKITSSSNSTIFNASGAYLDISDAIIEIDKEGTYAAVENSGTLTIGNNGFINTLKKNNRGIINNNYGDIIDGTGTITTYLDSSIGILNNSSFDLEYGGYKLVNTSRSSIGIQNQSNNDTEIHNIYSSGQGSDIYQVSDKKLVINNCDLKSSYSASYSVFTDQKANGSNVIINESRITNKIRTHESTTRTIEINDSTIDDIENNSVNIVEVGSYYSTSNGTIKINNSTINLYRSRVTNSNNMEINNSIINKYDKDGGDIVYNSNTGHANLLVNKTKINYIAESTSLRDYQVLTNYGTATIIDGKFSTTMQLNSAIYNKGSVTVKGDFETSDNFKYGIYSFDNYNNYNNRTPYTNIIGENDGVVSTKYPLIKGFESALYIDQASISSIYDGKFVGKNDISVVSKISDKPVNYDLLSTVDDEIQTITLKSTTGTNQEDYVAQVGSNKYTTIQAAVDAVPNTNEETEVKIINDIDTVIPVTISENKNVKLNYNGHYVRSYYDDNYITNNGKLKLVDDSGNVKESKSYSPNYIYSSGDYEHNSVNISSLYNNSHNVLNLNGTNSVINSGVLKSLGTIVVNNSNLVINNGDFITTNAYNDYNDLIVNSTGTTTVNGGYYDQTSTKSIFYNNNILNIHDGTFIARSSSNRGLTKDIDNGINGVVTVDGGNFDNRLAKGTVPAQYGLLINNKGTATIKDITSYHYGFFNNSEAGSLTFDNVIIPQVQYDSIDEDTGEVTIKDSEVTLIANIIYNDNSVTRINNSDMTFNSGHYIRQSANSSIYITNGSEISSTYRWHVLYRDGNESNNAYLEIDDSIIKYNDLNNINCGELLDIGSGIVVNIKSGSILNPRGSSIYTSGDNITINLGEEGGIPSKISPRIEASDKGINNPDRKTVINFYDGIVIGSAAIDGTVTKTETGYDIILETVDGKEHKYLDQLPAIKNIDKNLDYDDIQQAINEASDGDTLQVQREVTIFDTTPAITNTKTIVFDLNGNKIINNNALFMENGGILNIIDSKATYDTDNIYNGTGKIENLGGLIFNNTGTLTIDAGEFYSINKQLIANTGLLTINNGSYHTNNSGRLGVKVNLIENNIDTDNDKHGEVYINNGNFYNTGVYSSVIYNNNLAKVADGMFKFQGYTDSHGYHSGYSMVINNVTSTSNAEISGGTYPNYGLGILMENNGTATIKDVNSNMDYFVKNNAGGVLTIKDSSVGEETKRGLSGSTIISSGTLTIDNFSTNNVTVFGIDVNGGVATIKNSNIIPEIYRVIETTNDASLTIEDSIITGSYDVLDMDNDSSVTIRQTGPDKTMRLESTSTGNFYGINHESMGELNIESGDIIVNSKYGIKFETSTTTSPNRKINIGLKDGVVNTTPTISAGEKTIVIDYRAQYDLYDNFEINMYDGKLVADSAIDERINETETGYHITTSINSNSKEEAYLVREYVAKNGTASYYTVEEAFNNASNMDTVELLSNVIIPITGNPIVIPSGKNITFDLKGYTLSHNNTNFITNNGNLTLTDTSQTKTGIIKSYNSYILKNNGTFILNDGYIFSNRLMTTSIINDGTMNITSGTIDLYATEGGSELILNNGSINITGGTVKDNRTGCWCDNHSCQPVVYLINNTSTGSFTMSGGTFHTIERGAALNNDGTATITGGDFSNNTCGRSNDSNSYIFNNNNNLTVSGGDFGSQSKLLEKGLVYNNGTANVSNITSYFGNYSAYNKGDLTVQTSSFDTFVSITNYNGTMNLNNTTINSTRTGYNSLYADGGIININGSTIKNTQRSTIYIHDTNAPEININNSNILFDNSQASYSYYAIEHNSGTATLNVNSGNITSNKDYAIYITDSYSNLTTNIGVKGGTPSTTNPVISGKTYGIYNNSGSELYFYDGVIKGETGSIYGTLTDTESGYKEKRDDVTDPDTGVVTHESTLTPVGTSERVAVVNNVNFLSLQSAVNYASNNGYADIDLFKNVTLDDNLVLPAGGSNVTIHLNSNILNLNGFTYDSGITIDPPVSPGASLSRFLANVTGQEINPKNIVIFEMSDGSKLDSAIIYKLYKVIDGQEKVVKVNENKIGDYDLGSETDRLGTTNSRIYINGIGEGTYKLIGSDNKEMTFTITYDGVSNNIRINNTVKGNRTVSVIATLILQLQTGMVRSPYILIIMILIIGILGFIAYQKHKREE